MLKKTKFLWTIFALTLFLSIATLIAGYLHGEYMASFNNRIFSILDKYGTTYPMPLEEVQELDQFLSRPRLEPVTKVTISYWGIPAGSDDLSTQRVAYSYDTDTKGRTKFSIHGTERPWYLELTTKGNDAFLFKGFVAISVFFLLVSLSFLYLAVRQSHQWGKRNRNENVEGI